MNSKRNTVQKQLILAAVGELDTHATAEQVYEQVALAYPQISKATVYRNLHALTEEGLLLKIGSVFDSTHYDHRCHEHSHFVCERCERVFDMGGDFSDIIDRAQTQQGAQINAYQLTFSGICSDCADK